VRFSLQEGGEALETVAIREIPFVNATKEDVLTFLNQRMEQGEKTAVFTPNAEIMQRSVEDVSFRHVLLQGDVLVADGAGVLLAAKILGTPLKEKIPGVELGELLLSRTSRRVFFLGGREGVAEKAAEALLKKYPSLRAVGCRNGYFDRVGEENEAVLSAIRESGAEILLVCLGSPAQEMWISENREALPGVLTFLALGGSLDVYAGVEKRAPAPMIRLHMEWLWRLFRHPGRIGRMSKIPRFIFGTFLIARRGGKNSRA